MTGTDSLVPKNFNLGTQIYAITLSHGTWNQKAYQSVNPASTLLKSPYFTQSLIHLVTHGTCLNYRVDKDYPWDFSSEFVYLYPILCIKIFHHPSIAECSSPICII